MKGSTCVPIIQASNYAQIASFENVGRFTTEKVVRTRRLPRRDLPRFARLQAERL